MFFEDHLSATVHYVWDVLTFLVSGLTFSALLLLVQSDLAFRVLKVIFNHKI